MRGKLSTDALVGIYAGITPAGAGKTCTDWCRHAATEDHPRRCGENHFIFLSVLLSQGSPPQVRGKPRKPASKAVITGITPAGAGKTSVRIKPCFHVRDHPRRCGENPLYPSNNVRGLGSPPQVRGKRPCGGIASVILGITPAGAGKTFICLDIIFLFQDHPRRCGENGAFPIFAPHFIGSPPQVRGKLFGCAAVIISSRITPAGAGKTVWWFGGDKKHKDHPRRCGENK